ncbi:MAG: Rieske 2Fe-2S domain-containing protein, partial [Actinomycetota bacterium]|nr:Rieske 2Fe-2S domain-containing protein [Actinomycetota bacterium]
PTLLIRTGAGRLELAQPTVGDIVAYSKLCTHTGCPVGLYQQQEQLLLCPCHQSTFDVLHGAQPIFGPAARPLPQLPIGVDHQGFFVALGEFPQPVGGGFWDRGR